MVPPELTPRKHNRSLSPGNTAPCPESGSRRLRSVDFHTDSSSMHFHAHAVSPVRNQECHEQTKHDAKENIDVRIHGVELSPFKNLFFKKVIPNFHNRNDAL